MKAATVVFLARIAALVVLLACAYLAGFQVGREPQRTAERIQQEKVAVSVIIEALGAYQRSLTNSPGP